MLSEKSVKLQTYYIEDKEIVYFSDVKECDDKIKFYLKNDDIREKIAIAGYNRAVSSGYSNDERIKLAISEYLQSL